MRALTLVAVCLVASPAAGGERPFTTEERRAAMRVAALSRASFDRELFDYPTARFRDVRANLLKGGKTPSLCGFVNSKNRLGAYVGWKAFTVFESEGRAEISTDELFVEIACRPSEERDFDTRDYSAALSGE